MTLTDIISKIILYAKRGIISDNSTGVGLSVSQSGTGGAISIQTTARGKLDLMPSTGGEITYDGSTDGVFAFSNISAAATKATCFLGANFGIETNAPTEKLHVVGNIRVDGAIFAQTSSGSGTSLIVGNDCSIVDIGYPNVFGLYGSYDENLGGIRLGKTGPLIYGATNNFGVNTPTPAKTLHVNGTVRLQGLPTYANNAAAIAGGLVADDVYKTATGELRIVV